MSYLRKINIRDHGGHYPDDLVNIKNLALDKIL